MKNLKIIFLGMWLVLVASCATTYAPVSRETLKSAFEKHFSIGVAINQRQFTGRDASGEYLITNHFNSISPENDLKWERVHPRPGAEGYDFSAADAYVAFGERHRMLIVGHTLAWHSQTPDWVFQDDQGRWLSRTNQADRELLLNRLREHIQTVVKRYQGRIQIWDVVNEALNDSRNLNDTNILRRQSPWVRVLGVEFIVKAFEYAHAADPHAILRYNDYSLENPAKRRRLIALIKYLQARHVPVMAIGSQTHANLIWPTAELEESFLTEVSQLGLPIHITELDVNASQAGQRNQSADVAEVARIKADTAMEDSVDTKLAQQYQRLFEVFLKHRDTVKLVTFWGVTDQDSWLRNAQPLLFDAKAQPKPAFHAVLRTVQ